MDLGLEAELSKGSQERVSPLHGGRPSCSGSASPSAPGELAPQPERSPSLSNALRAARWTGQDTQWHRRAGRRLSRGHSPRQPGRTARQHVGKGWQGDRPPRLDTPHCGRGPSASVRGPVRRAHPEGGHDSALRLFSP